MNRIGLDELLSLLPDNTSDEDITLALLQAAIASQITIQRAKRGMNQSQFAEFMGVKQSLVSRWENCETNFTLETLVKIASKLDIEIQCPFKLEPAPASRRLECKVIAFPGTERGWNNTNYKSNDSYTELKEM